MNNTVRTIGFCLIGAATGGMIGLFIAGKLRAEQLAEEEWARKVEESRKEYETQEAADMALESYSPPTEEEPKKDEPENKPGKKNGKVVPYTDYTEFSRRGKPRLEDIDVDKLDGIGKDLKADQKAPYLIDLDQYALGDVGHEKVTFTYWNKDGILSNEDNDVITNGDKLLGENWRTKFGQQSDDPDIFHIRNNAEGIDYEVSRVNNSYNEEVLGIKPKKPSKPKTKKVEKFDGDPSSEGEE